MVVITRNRTMRNNLYWPVYKTLEKEVLELANQIHFDDKQAEVYSVKLAELLIRCATEIESLSKTLYRELGGNMTPIDNETGLERNLYFDKDCIKFLEDKWHISKKIVEVIAPNFYFTSDKYCSLTPLHNAHKIGRCSWKKAYQAVKHDRTNNLEHATVANVVSALAALYLLNIYYRDEQIRPQNNGPTVAVDTSLGSDVFRVLVTSKIPDMILAEKEDDGYDKFTYLAVMSDDLCESINQAIENDNKIANQILESSVQTYLDLGNKLSGNAKDRYELAMEVGGTELLKRLARQQTRLQLYFNSRRICVLNKNQPVYGKPLPEPEPKS